MKPALLTQMSTGPDLALRLADRVGELGAVRDVHLVAARDAALGGDLLGRLGGALGVQVEHDDLAPLGGEREAVGLAEAPRAARDERHASLDAEVHRYLPLNWAGRFWKKAWMPSPASSVLRTLSKARISISRAWSMGAWMPSSTASMMSRVAMGGRLTISRASALASLSVSPSLDRRLTRPMR